MLTRLFMDRGVRLDRTYQLNFGGNTDFLNMLERERLESKKISKTNAVTSMLDYELDPGRRPRRPPATTCPGSRTASGATSGWRARPSATCRSTAELKLEVWDSPNSAGVITDAIRCLKLGLDRGLSGHARGALGYFMKSPPLQIHDDIARKRVEAFIRGEDNETLVGTETRRPRRRARSSAIARQGRGRRPSSADGRSPDRAVGDGSSGVEPRHRDAVRRRGLAHAPDRGLGRWVERFVVALSALSERAVVARLSLRVLAARRRAARLSLPLAGGAMR